MQNLSIPLSSIFIHILWLISNTMTNIMNYVMNFNNGQKSLWKRDENWIGSKSIFFCLIRKKFYIDIYTWFNILCVLLKNIKSVHVKLKHVTVKIISSIYIISYYSLTILDIKYLIFLHSIKNKAYMFQFYIENVVFIIDYQIDLINYFNNTISKNMFLIIYNFIIHN